MENAWIAIPLLGIAMALLFFAISGKNEARNWIIACFLIGLLILSQTVEIKIDIEFLKKSLDRQIIVGFALTMISFFFGVIYLMSKK